MRTKGSKRIKPRVIDAIIAAKVLYPGYSANRILWVLSLYRKAFCLGGDVLPRKRSVQFIIKNNQPEIDKRMAERKTDPLDDPWTIGSCLEYNISLDTLPKLLSIKNVFSSPNEKWPEIILSNRVARWINLFWNRLFEMVQQEPDESDLQFMVRKLETVSMVGMNYALREQIAQTTGKRFPDTSDLDTTYFVDGNLSDKAIRDGWFKNDLEDLKPL